MNPEKIIVAKNLAATYQKKAIWKDANFELEEGQFVAVLGPNGSGKSTLFKLLLGLKEASKGELKLFGENPKKNAKLIGYVPQRRGFDQDTNFDVFDFVKLGLNGHKFGISFSRKENQLTKEALTLVDAYKFKDKALGELSGGELQRVFLAQALVGNPKILLLDEPLANLDLKRETELVSLVKDLSEKKKICVLLIAHDLNPLVGSIDKIIYIANHNLVSGTVDEIINSEQLSKLYGSEIEVIKDSKGRLVIVGARQAAHHV